MGRKLHGAIRSSLAPGLDGYGSCSSLVRHKAYCYIARKAGRDERRLSLDLMPNQSPKGRYGKIAWQKTGGRA